MSVRHAGSATLPTPRSPAQPGHLGRRAGLIDEHQALRVDVRLPVEPGLAPREHVGPLLLAGVCRFF
jgi:hypothetical protein